MKNFFEKGGQKGKDTPLEGFRFPFPARLRQLKNIPGCRLERKLVAFSVDDYGNVRLASRAALERLGKTGLRLEGRFDCLDALETREDLEALLEVLGSVRDSVGRPAAFTPYALSANPDFAAMRRNPERYWYEDLPSTFKRVAAEDPQAYEGAWALWLEGIRKGFLRPQFHGREHLNLDLLERKLARRDRDVIANLENRSMAGLSDDAALPGIGFTHAFGVSDRTDIARHKGILSDGLALFARVFGRPARSFTPPAQKLHPALYEFMEQGGIRAIDKPFYAVRRIDSNRTRRELNFLGRARRQGHVTIVRNVVFEPNLRPDTDEVARTLSQIEAAFHWRKPAIISSHRVNFCGHIEPANRRAGLGALKRLLQGIVRRWPDVEFIGVDDLAQRIEAAA
jgi:hypothetical protein